MHGYKFPVPIGIRDGVCCGVPPQLVAPHLPDSVVHQVLPTVLRDTVLVLHKFHGGGSGESIVYPITIFYALNSTTIQGQ